MENLNENKSQDREMDENDRTTGSSANYNNSSEAEGLHTKNHGTVEGSSDNFDNEDKDNLITEDSEFEHSPYQIPNSSEVSNKESDENRTDQNHMELDDNRSEDDDNAFNSTGNSNADEDFSDIQDDAHEQIKGSDADYYRDPNSQNSRG